MLATLIGWGVIAIAGYFVLKFTFDFVMNKIDEIFKDPQVDEATILTIQKLMEETKKTNTRSYETLKKAWEKGYTHITAKVADGKIKDGVEVYKDSSETPDQKVKDMLGDEGMVVIKR